MKETTTKTPETAEEYYSKVFMPGVHRIGRGTMAVALVLSFLPVLYFILVKGYGLPVSSYIAAAVAVASISLGFWLTEPEAYWPVLGSAGTYIGYLSGNVSGMRFPVAVTLQRNMDADINTPRGQIVTIVGIVSSVVVNLVLLLIIVLAGNWVLSVLPEAVLGAFSFVMATLLGSMILNTLNSKEGIAKGTMKALPYLVTAVVIKLLINGPLNFLVSWGMAISVFGCLAVAYCIYRRDLKKAESND